MSAATTIPRKIRRFVGVLKIVGLRIRSRSSAIDSGVTIERSEVEHSIILAGARVSDLSYRMEASLIGRNVVLESSNSLPRAYRFMVGDNSEIRLH